MTMEQRGPNSIFSDVSVSVTLAHMAITLAYKEEIPVGAKRLPDWLISHGITAITTDEAAKLMAIPKGQVRNSHQWSRPSSRSCGDGFSQYRRNAPPR